MFNLTFGSFNLYFSSPSFSKQVDEEYVNVMLTEVKNFTFEGKNYTQRYSIDLFEDSRFGLDYSVVPKITKSFSDLDKIYNEEYRYFMIRTLPHNWGRIFQARLHRATIAKLIENIIKLNNSLQDR